MPAVEICILQQNLFDDEHFRHTFQMADFEREVLLFKDAEIHIIELEKFDKEVTEVRTPIERWCYFLKHAATLDRDDLPEPLRTPALVRAMEVLMRIKETQEDSETYRQRILKQVDTIYRQLPEQKVFELGEAQGIEKGIEKGIQEGRKEGQADRIRLAQRILKLPVTPRGELLKETLAELTALGDHLEAQIPSE